MTVLEVILTRGLPASGKTTWARAKIASDPMFVRVSKDDLRRMIGAQFEDSADPNLIHKLRDAVILIALDAGRSVIVDDTNIDPWHAEHIADVVGDRATVKVMNLETSVEECIVRNSQRTEPVGEDIIRELSDRL